MSKIKINKLVKAGLSRNMVSQLSERAMDVLIQKFILDEQTTMVPARDQATIKKLPGCGAPKGSWGAPNTKLFVIINKIICSRSYSILLL